MKKRKKFPPLKSTRCSIWVKAILKIHLSLKYSYKNTHTTINFLLKIISPSCVHANTLTYLLFGGILIVLSTNEVHIY